MGSPMLLLWPKAPVRAEPEYVIEFKVSTAIAFEAAATTVAASCAAAPAGSDAITSAKGISVLTRIGASRIN